MTHEELRKRAIKWLTGSKGCGVVLSEIVTAAMEVPDAIGWKHRHSYLVECKVSRADWQRNAKKYHERIGRSAGSFRYILCPEGLINAAEIDGDWGLLWLYESGNVRVQKEAQTRESCRESEVAMLVSALRRVRAREFLVIVPEECAHVSMEGPER